MILGLVMSKNRWLSMDPGDICTLMAGFLDDKTTLDAISRVREVGVASQLAAGREDPRNYDHTTAKKTAIYVTNRRFLSGRYFAFFELIFLGLSFCLVKRNWKNPVMLRDTCCFVNSWHPPPPPGLERGKCRRAAPQPLSPN